MFVPFCCTNLANIRRYVGDGSGTVLAERANEFASLPNQLTAPPAYSTFRGGYLWVSYLCGSPDDYSRRFVAVKRYTPDLSDERSYEIYFPNTLQGNIDGQAYYNSYGTWQTSEATGQNRQDHFTVDSSGNVIAAIQGEVLSSSPYVPASYKWHVRSWNPDGTLRWVASNPASPAADQSAIIGVHAVGNNGKCWVIYAQRVAGSITPEDPAPQELIEVLAARYSVAGVKETTLSLAMLNKILTPAAISGDVFEDVSRQVLHKLFYSTSNGQTIAVCSARLRYTPADDTVTYHKHFRCAIIQGETASYTWFRLIRPAAGGATSQLNGYAAQNGGYGTDGDGGDVTSLNEISAIMLPRSDKGNVNFGIWIRVGTLPTYVSTYYTFPVESLMDGANWWNYTLGGTFQRYYPTQVPESPYFREGDVKTILPTGETLHGACKASPVGYDRNGAWHFVRQTYQYRGALPSVYFGTVFKVRDNASEAWETPPYDVALNSSNNPQTPPSQISIAVPGPDDLDYGGYYLVGARAF